MFSVINVYLRVCMLRRNHCLVARFTINLPGIQDKNKMSANNLAMCMGPNLLRPAEETIEYTLNIAKANGVVLRYSGKER